MSLIRGIHHISLKSSNQQEYDALIQFYRDTLELSVVRQWATGIMLDAGSGLIEIFNNGTESLLQGTIRHFALATDDVDACVAKVQAAGYEVFIGPKDIEIPSDPVFPARMAFCRGPLGEEIEFFQEC